MIPRRAVLLSLVGLLLGLPVWATDNTPPEGFVSLFNGKNLLGWKVPTGDNGHWKVVDGVIDYDAQLPDRGRLAFQHHGGKNKEGDWSGPPSLVQFKNVYIKELPRPRPTATRKVNVRALLITGGHDHETSFYSLFDGYKDLGRLPVSSSATAFQSDLRGKYDVLIMYDFSRDLDETGKKNLRDFVESGKGIVVLHHALLNYQKWPWWYEEVVGGSYRLQTEGDNPSSSVKDDQQIFVAPEGKHPITAGLEPFQIAGRDVQAHVDLSPGPAAADHRQPHQRPVCWRGSARAPHRGWSPSSWATAHRRSAIRRTGRWSTTPSSGRPDGSSDSHERGRSPDRSPDQRQARNCDETGTLQHHLPGSLVPRRGSAASRR